jgi:UDP-N-acetyl-D-glucosamine dehydrogenase
MGKISAYELIKKKIKTKKAIIAVIGLGYVGLPIALEFIKKGFTVIGLDNNERRIRGLKKGKSHINDISDKKAKDAVTSGKFNVTSDPGILSKADVVIICVPTPLRKVKDPDISYITKASKSLKNCLRKGQLIVLESTTYPGTTREVILPILEQTGLKLDEDFFLAFSPERIDPGNPKYDFTNIPKVIGGITEHGSDLGRILYSCVVKKVVPVSSPEVAEVTKLLENTFRIVNIGLINEFANLCNKLHIDVWEVIKAAKTKPFGFMSFYPGPGIGGHCIPADPMYLSWKAQKVGFETKMIDLAAKVNRNMPVHVVERIIEILAADGKKIKEAKIGIIGVSYKRDVNDLRESPAIDIIEHLRKKKALLEYHDPFIPYLDLYGIKDKSTKLTKAFLGKQDLVVIITDHSDVNYEMIADNAKRVFDTRNVFEAKGIKAKNVVKL